MDLVLHTDASYRNDLDTGKFARMLDDPSQCYKFYWLEAILNLLPTEEGDISFEKIIDEMICDAWYSVTRYKLHLGPTIRGKCENALERAINVINRDDQMSYASSKDEIMHGIEQQQAEIRADKLTLTINVPYRLLSSFLDEIGGSNKMWYKSGEMIRYISLLNQDTALQYKMYETVFSHEQIQKAFEKCRRDNLNVMWAVENLYIPGNTEEQFTNILEHNLRPVYDAAKLQGYGLWRYTDYVVIR